MNHSEFVVRVNEKLKQISDQMHDLARERNILLEHRALVGSGREVEKAIRDLEDKGYFITGDVFEDFVR